jgi:hypothetical protein
MGITYFQEAEYMTSESTEYKSAKNNLMLRAGLCLLSLVIGIQAQSSADEPQSTPRKIVSDAFTKNRPQAALTESPRKPSEKQPSLVASSKTKPRRTYRLASQPIRKTSQVVKGMAVAQLGITIWRLRPATVTDSGARMLVREKGKSNEWVPERVEADATFSEGDHLRLSIESPQTGYLYVVDRDLFADGTTGEAKLIYPWADLPTGDNEMRPGKLVDIPSQDDDPSYFTARPASGQQVGEILTVIITTMPLDLRISNKPIQIANRDLDKWEKMWGGQSARFEMEGGAGETWTNEEKQAAVRKGRRQLTRDDPAPQTIYRVSTTDNKAILVNVQLRYMK